MLAEHAEYTGNAVVSWLLWGLEDLIEVPFQEVTAEPLGAMLRQVDDLPCRSVNLFAVVDVRPPGADRQPVTGRRRGSRV